jgi:hypothetical protein
MELYPAFATIHIFSSGNLNSFAVDKGINHFLSGLLQVVPEGFSGDAHHVRCLVLFNMKEITKADGFKFFYGQSNNF